MAQLLLGVSRLIQHSENSRPYWLHLGWVLTMFIYSVFWWWWEFNLREIEVCTFGAYLLVILYAFLIFLLCALLSPVILSGYDSFEEYYYAKRAWIFGTFLVIQFVDSGVALTKGTDYFLGLGIQYFIAQSVIVFLSAVAIVTRNKSFHAAFVIVLLIIPGASGIPVLRDHLERPGNGEVCPSFSPWEERSVTWKKPTSTCVLLAAFIEDVPFVLPQHATRNQWLRPDRLEPYTGGCLTQPGSSDLFCLPRSPAYLFNGYPGHINHRCHQAAINADRDKVRNLFVSAVWPPIAALSCLQSSEYVA
jgi:hypothetical protein